MRARSAAPLLVLAFAACGSPPPPAPPPFAGEPRPRADDGALLGPMLSAVPEPLPAPAKAPPAPPEPAVHFAIEPPFRLDQRVIPKTKEAFLADLRDRTAWNQGGLGALAAEPPPVPGHPAPKVIIDVGHATGALRAADAQRVLRKGFWIKVVECFSLSAYKDQKLRGAASFVLGVGAGGKVSDVHVGRHDFKEPDVPRCLGNHLRAFALPAAKGRSTLSVDIQVGHGDEPVPPPASLIVPGDGTLAPAEIQAAIEAARPGFEACFKAALAYAPELWGRLGLRFHVTEKGKTDEVFEVESRFPDERVSLCVLRAARQMTFPTPAGGDLRFIVPLRFWSDRSAVPKAPDPG